MRREKRRELNYTQHEEWGNSSIIKFRDESSWWTQTSSSPFRMSTPDVPSDLWSTTSHSLGGRKIEKNAKHWKLKLCNTADGIFNEGFTIHPRVAIRAAAGREGKLQHQKITETWNNSSEIFLFPESWNLIMSFNWSSGRVMDFVCVEGCRKYCSRRDGELPDCLGANRAEREGKHSKLVLI